MESWLERMRKKPEGTRRAIALGIFLAIMGVVVTIWLWNLQGAFPYGGITAGARSVSSGVDKGIRNVQDFRATLGIYKQRILDAVSSSQRMEQVDLTMPNGNAGNASSTTEQQY